MPSTTVSALPDATAKPKTATMSKTAITIIGLMIAAAAFSIFFMMPQSVGLDESQSLWQAAHTIPGIFFVVSQDVHVPLYHILLHFWMIAFGNGIPASRALSLLFYLPAIPLTYLLGKRAFGSRIGLMGAVLFTISPFANWYGSVIRMYSLLTLVSIVNQIFFILIFKGNKEKNRAYWIGYIVSGAIGIYTHYFFWFNLLAQALFFFAYRNIFPKGSFKKFVIAAAILVILISPWLAYVHHEGGLGTNTSPALLAPTTIDVFNTFSNFLFGFQADAVNSIILALWPLIILLLLFSLKRGNHIAPETAYLMAATFIPIGVAAIASHIVHPFFLSRYFISVLPVFCLMIAWFLSRYSKPLAAVTATTLIAGMGVGLWIQTVNAQAPIKEDYRDAADYVAQNATARDIVAVSTPFTIYPFEYYYNGPANVITLPEWDRLVSGPIPPFSTSTLAQNAQAFNSIYQNVWLILSYDQGYEKTIQQYFDGHYQRLFDKTFSPDLTVLEYRVRYDQVSMNTVLKNTKASRQK